jgi:ATP-dependent helicase HrpB
METLPIDAVLPRLRQALAEGTAAVVSAPPGAGKTTRVPLALLGAPWLAGRILMLEPRRIAARAAAERLAASLGEPVGQSVGYRIRGESRPGSRIEVVTEGVLTRMLQASPDLPGVGAILFDEVHERSIHSDLGLALALEVQEALRPELRILAMSATLDVAGFARLLGGAPVIASKGRLHPVETRWLDRPWRRPGEGRRGYLEAAVALILTALDETREGDVLAFLPGAGEIGRAAARLRAERSGLEVAELHGSLPFARQRAVLARPAGGPCRLVLATSLAETSLTVPGVRVVVDTGLARRSRTDAGTGLSRLVTVPVSRAEAEQRRGRAGRLGPGVCYRMWTRGEEGGLPPFAPPEILETDLGPLALELAAWGAAPGGLRWLDPPPAAALASARALLAELGALDAEGRITAHGRAVAAEPLHPRLAHMLVLARARGHAAEAALLAALLSDRDPLRGERGGAGADLRERVLAVAGEDPRADVAAVARIRAEAARIAGHRSLEPETPSPSLPHKREGGARGQRRAQFTAAGQTPSPSLLHKGGGKRPAAGTPRRAEALSRDAGHKGEPAEHGPVAADRIAGALAAAAYPDRIALRRAGAASDEARYLLSGGRGAVLAAADPLAGERLLVATDLEDGPEARIRLAAPLTEVELRAVLGHRIRRVETVEWSTRAARVEARRREMLGAIALADEPWPEAPPDRLGAALANGVRAAGIGALEWPKAAQSLRARARWLRRQGGELAATMPDWSDEGLLANLEDWLVPHLAGLRRIDQIGRLDLTAILRGTVDWQMLGEIDRRAPAWWETPLGRAGIDYSGDRPTVSLRVQELFGVTRHPTVGQPPVPLLIELLSPAMRPVQATADLPGFWAGSYADVRREMRARYPRHPWPEDPAAAEPTRRTKPSGG